MGGNARLWLDADPVVHRSANSLFTSEITLGGLHGNMSEEELDLLQLSSCRMAQLRTRAPQVVRSETREANAGGVELDDVPHHSLGHAITPPLSSPANASK